MVIDENKLILMAHATKTLSNYAKFYEKARPISWIILSLHETYSGNNLRGKWNRKRTNRSMQMLINMMRWNETELCSINIVPACFVVVDLECEKSRNSNIDTLLCICVNNPFASRNQHQCKVVVTYGQCICNESDIDGRWRTLKHQSTWFEVCLFTCILILTVISKLESVTIAENSYASTSQSHFLSVLRRSNSFVYR